MTNIIADLTFQTATISSDGTIAQNDDGSWRIDFTGSGGSWVILPLSVPLVPGHEYQVTFGATGTPHNLKPTLLQDGGSGPATIGNPPNLWAEGTYDATISYSAPNGRVKIWNYAMSGQPFSLQSTGLAVTDLDA